MPLNRLVLTPGEPAGIGPDLVVRLAQQPRDCEIIAICDPDLLTARARMLDLPLSLDILGDTASPATATRAGQLRVMPVPLAAPCHPGTTDPANASYVLTTLAQAIDLCRARQADAMVTGPVHKAVINQAGHAFSGHTHFIADRTGAAHVVMMLVTPGLRVALATVHIPLAEVPTQLTRSSLASTIRVLDADLRCHFGIPRPRILVAGLNPHAGESGYLGREEIDVIEPVLDQARGAGVDVEGPLPADTLFTPDKLARADAVLAMYHDQGLPVIKHLGFGCTVNVTLGLPIIRTSVDHGTALDLAGTDAVDTGSMDAAVAMADELATHARA
ncbi:4-hydroxythreonine-4-phosphate dehydrogenase PdxA [Spectribacter hydrogenoxidans]|uniref:4-hydroxythreonine-4-phosphate dehydrogenase n=1 Tax=Spectribacter hydrogenoxidans TaxID=3075608 RepID=A0ABU3C3X9_9GAMM|nr:4-hydroxythreonine-4-phosphate dehydrogenase PdxA [Salinisphaera sp. W335]MDT0636049.1 4-hydroxythreonine-4-phosphate dehydrogenase PdxA [Salinisphaera sp. W335]